MSSRRSSPRTASTAVPPPVSAATGPAVQLLTPDGERVEHPDFPVGPSPEECRELYRGMVLTRRLDTEAVALQRQGELGLWPEALGQEAAQIGSAHALGPDDYAFPSYREHGVALSRGVDPLDLMAIFRGVNHGSWSLRETRTQLYTLVVGSQALHATGYAMGLQRNGVDGTVVAYFGDGATSQGDVNEAFVFASVFDAPVVFFCQNNQWAISEPLERQSRLPLHERARGFGFPGVRVDGNDALACLSVTRWALDHARAGNGPVLIEAYTYRMGAHTTSDDPTRYRDPDELREWRRKDPIDRLRTYLTGSGLADARFLTAVDEEAEAMAVRLRTGCRNMPDPDPMSVFDHAYADGHALVAAEREWFAAYQASFIDEPSQET